MDTIAINCTADPIIFTLPWTEIDKDTQARITAQHGLRCGMSGNEGKWCAGCTYNDGGAR
jgi:hypothetical protein